MAEGIGSIAEDSGGYVAFRMTGEVVKGAFHCSECSYGVTVYRALPACPMCGGTSWEQAPWRPLTRTIESGWTAGTTA